VTSRHAAAALAAALAAAALRPPRLQALPPQLRGAGAR
jgi:hypothetical protein